MQRVSGGEAMGRKSDGKLARERNAENKNKAQEKPTRGGRQKFPAARNVLLLGRRENLPKRLGSQ